MKRGYGIGTAKENEVFHMGEGETEKESCLGREGNTGRNLPQGVDELSSASASV